MISPPDSTSPDRAQLIQKSMRLLGWPLVQNALAGRAVSGCGADRCRTLTPANDYETARLLLLETQEMADLLESAESLHLESFDDIAPIIREAQEQRILNPGQCLSILKVLRLIRIVRQHLEKYAEGPLLKEKTRHLEPLPDLLRDINRCIDDDGEIRDNATPELRQALREVQGAKQKLENHVSRLMSSALYREAVQDTFFTEREERCVIPIRAEWRSRIEGIVHDSSGSGQTLFMEPVEIIPLNNQLKINRIRVEQEKLKILQDLTRKVAEQAGPLLRNQETLVELDLIHAKIQLAFRMSARPCPLMRDGQVRLKQARNPELVLNGQVVVPNDITWKSSVKVVIISGPNTGGKTVTLKTLGLMSLMSQAGLFLPVEEDSEIPFFPEVYADIGDDQNIQLNLSTFSAHLEKIIHILDHALPGSLILLDELGIATDPLEGASLAEAILVELKNKGVMTLVSTHYLALKVLAQTREGFLNACTEFDSDSLSPTYRLVFGAPGKSAALDTAERLGLPDRIIHRARDIYKTKDSQADAFLQDLTRQRLELERERDFQKNKREEAEQWAREQRQLAEKLRESEKEFQKNKAKRMQSVLRDAKNQVRKMISEVKGTKDLSQLRKTEKTLRSMGRAPMSALRKDLSGWEIPANRLKKGDAVVVETYGAMGVLLESPTGKKRVRVKLGNLVTLVDMRYLKGHVKNHQQNDVKPEKFEVNIQTDPASKGQTSCDLRGMNSDQALDAVEGFISQAVVNKIHRAKIIHGHGMGTIKRLVRDYLETTGICKSFGPAPREDGGDGVTLIEL